MLRGSKHNTERSLRSLLTRSLGRRPISFERAAGRNVLVFAPHQDDETLGCGGTIIQMIKHGLNVTIVFTTDGCMSHSHLMTKSVLRRKRAEEAFTAARILGLKSQDVIFLPFENRKLAAIQERAVMRVHKLLVRKAPAMVFAPSRHERPDDHVATNRIVRMAIKHCGIATELFEYPIWLWHQWPWVRVPQGGLHHRLGFAIASVFGNYRFAREFRYSVDVSEVREQKFRALCAYESQMTRLVDHQDWMILADVAQGDFLSCFRQEREVFRRIRMN